MLPLAERMIDKFIKDGKIEAEQEIQLYIMVLEMQDSFDVRKCVEKFAQFRLER